MLDAVVGGHYIINLIPTHRKAVGQLPYLPQWQLHHWCTIMHSNDTLEGTLQLDGGLEVPVY